jgi:hypothetical protein
MRLVFAGGLLKTEGVDYHWENPPSDLFSKEIPTFLTPERRQDACLKVGEYIHVIDLGPTPTSVHPVGKSWKVTKVWLHKSDVGDLIGVNYDTEPLVPSPAQKFIEVAKQPDSFYDEPCRVCDGCGKVADTPDQEPWTVWTNLPANSAVAVVLGVVKPMDCPECHGSGKRKR